LRSSLTMLGIIIGNASVITLVGLGRGAQTLAKNQLSNSDFDKNGLDSHGIHWLQYAAFAVSGFAIFTTWAFFYDEKFHNFIMNIFRVINCSGFNCNGAF